MAERFRPATPNDLRAIIRIYRDARQKALPGLAVVHTPEEDVAFFGALIDSGDTVVVETASDVIAFAAWRGDSLNHLYVDPQHQGRGLGSGLLAAAKDGPACLRAWTFQRNKLARAFYEAHGFVPTTFTEGDNEEGEPDVLYVWTRP